MVKPDMAAVCSFAGGRSRYQESQEEEEGTQAPSPTPAPAQGCQEGGVSIHVCMREGREGERL